MNNERLRVKRIISVIIISCVLWFQFPGITGKAAENLPSFIDVAYGKGTFVAIDGSGGIAISPNCIDWNYVIFKSSNTPSPSPTSTVTPLPTATLRPTATPSPTPSPISLKISLEASASLEGISLKWSNSNITGSKIIGYNLYKGVEQGKYEKVPVTDFPIEALKYTDKKIIRGSKYFYICKAVFEDGRESNASNEVSVNAFTKDIVLQVDNHIMTVNGVPKEIDPGKGTKPIIIDGRTLLPVRSLIEELGGSVIWNYKENKVTIIMDSKVVELWVGSKFAKVNGVEKTVDVPPQIINTRTMVPLRFIAENLECNVVWEVLTKKIYIKY